jgi:hypothetical protein
LGGIRIVTLDDEFTHKALTRFAEARKEVEGVPDVRKINVIVIVII